MDIEQNVADWKQKGLGTRASYVLSKAEIGIAQLANYGDIDALLNIKNCGTETGREIWDFIKNLNTDEQKAGVIKEAEDRTGIKEVNFEELIPNSEEE